MLSAALHVTAVRFWSLGEVTRVAIEVDGEFRYQSDRLANPERIFFDVAGAKPKLSGQRIHAIPVGDRLVKQIRVAETRPGTTRVVLDVEPRVEFSASQLGSPDRLMIELKLAAKEPSLGAPPALKPETVLFKEAPPVVTAIAPPLKPPALGRAARRTSEGGSSLIRALGLKVTRVVIDPGHGGHDTGTVGPRGLSEKELVLDVAQRLGKLIEDHMGSEVIYTRSDDTFVPLEARTELANAKQADLFLSLHANSSRYARIGGPETYYLNFTTSQDAIEVASRENASSEKSVHELRDIIQKITLHDKAEESKEFAGQVQAALHTFSARSNAALKNRGVKKAPFVVLIGASMPSVLAEIGFISNPREETLLKRPEQRQRLAEALYRGVSRYAQTLSHFQVASTQ